MTPFQPFHDAAYRTSDGSIHERPALLRVDAAARRLARQGVPRRPRRRGLHTAAPGNDAA